MMLTKVQYNTSKWLNNEVNNTKTRMGVDIIEADGIAADYSNYGSNVNYWGKPGDLFPTGATEYMGITEYPIKDIQEEDGVITFNFKDATSSTEDVEANNEVLAIYNILGQKQTTTDIEALPRGTYIVVRSSGSHKVVR